MITFIIPYRPDNSKEREDSFKAVSQVLGESFPDDQVVVCDNVGQFNRSAARNFGALMAKGDVLVFVDADSFVDHKQIETGVAAVREGAGWVLPYDMYFNLTDSGTQKFYGDDPPPYEHEYVFPSESHPVPAVGGCVVISREAFLKVRGYDERFIGWGLEDRAFCKALQTLVGPEHRVCGSLLHLWHPAPESVRFNQPYFRDNQVLYEQYLAAGGTPEDMQKLVDERF